MNDLELYGSVDFEKELSCTIGLRGPKGEKGDIGLTGPQGDAATVSIGTVATGAPGTGASVVNSGTPGAAVFDFTIPRGTPGEVTEQQLYAAVDAEKRRARRGYACRLRGAASHDSLVGLTDCADCSDFNEITVYGKTAAFGSGDKSPINPYMLTGQQPSKITVNDEEYPIALSEPLFCFDGARDCYKAVSGEEKRALTHTVLKGEEAWQKYASNPTQNVYFITIPDTAIGFQTSVCSHFINVNLAWGAIYGSFGKYTDHDTIAGRKYFNMGSECPDVEDFKAWLHEEYTAGRPVTLISKSAALSIVQHAPMDIPQPGLTADIGAGGAPLSVEYSRDVTAVIDGLAAAVKGFGGTL